MLKLNGTRVEATVFPDGTRQIWKLPTSIIESNQACVIDWKYLADFELLELAQLVTLLRARSQYRPRHVTLNISYLPYGRQDKTITNEQAFGLHIFAKILNSLQIDEINVLDPHSEVAQDVIYNLTPVYPVWEVAATFGITNSNIILYPDKGAAIKYKDVYKRQYITATKERCPITGKIYSVYLDLGVSVKDKRILIVDDICDGGATFIQIANLLRSEEVGEINLFVTHGIFSKGLKDLYRSGIDNIFTAKGKVSPINKDFHVVGYENVFGDKL